MSVITCAVCIVMCSVFIMHVSMMVLGQLSISQRARQKQEESHKKSVDEWKKQHYEEELSE